MIEEFENEDLKNPKTLRVIIKDLNDKLKELKKKLEEDEKTINDPDTGIRVAIKDINDDIDALDKKLNEILKSQSETRKTVKNVSLSTVLTGVIGTIVAFVMKQLGFY
ncbi:hypothetical protein [Staphylococcus simulans]|uniref:hypothetical protein n=1 Tax=Staphylococcus simulans TaxID=1286 RepID=UPI000F6FD9B9|nr:hypothetical protein [Staphylococcus simulans]VED60388.1 Uncharacterised protein [Staphylococcus simulans]